MILEAFGYGKANRIVTVKFICIRRLCNCYDLQDGNETHISNTNIVPGILVGTVGKELNIQMFRQLEPNALTKGFRSIATCMSKNPGAPNMELHGQQPHCPQQSLKKTSRFSEKF